MNLSKMLKEDRYQSTIYLNDRPYEVLDIGEGKCLIVMVDSIKAYLERNKTLRLKQRLILVDISKVIQQTAEEQVALDRQLAIDLHLLFDVFWLGEVEIHSELNHINMRAIYDVVRIRNAPYAAVERVSALTSKTLSHS